MSNRILVDVGNVIDCAASREVANELHCALATVADEINSALPEYETTLVHLDTADYLAFSRRPDPAEGEYWRELEEERRQMLEGAEGND